MGYRFLLNSIRERTMSLSSKALVLGLVQWALRFSQSLWVRCTRGKTWALRFSHFSVRCFVGRHARGGCRVFLVLFGNCAVFAGRHEHCGFRGISGLFINMFSRDDMRIAASL